MFPFAHATHPDSAQCCELVLAQLRGHMASEHYASSPSLGLLYITDQYAARAQDILDHLGAELPWVTDWVGTTGVGIAANNVEYFDEPAMCVMLCDLSMDQYRVFSGVSPLSAVEMTGFEPHTALIHADGQTADVADLIEELAQRTQSGYVFGGLSSSRGFAHQFALSSSGNVQGQGLQRGVLSGGLSGVAFAQSVAMVSRVTQGCSPVSKVRTITACEGHVVLMLDGEPALDVLLHDLGVSLEQPRAAIAKVQQTLVGISASDVHALGKSGHFEEAVMVRHIIGLDPAKRGIAVAQALSVGQSLTFCERNAQAAKADLMRMGTQIRDSLEPEDWPQEVPEAWVQTELSQPHPARKVLGAIYISCAGRGGPHFGAPSAELQCLRRALGDVPLVGFFAGGEIAHQNLYGYTGVLTVFTQMSDQGQEPPSSSPPPPTPHRDPKSST